MYKYNQKIWNVGWNIHFSPFVYVGWKIPLSARIALLRHNIETPTDANKPEGTWVLCWQFHEMQITIFCIIEMYN